MLGAPGTSGTTSVSSDDAESDPAMFLAVSTTRSDEPTSPVVTEYDEPVAPEISEQVPSHCCH